MPDHLPAPEPLLVDDDLVLHQVVDDAVAEEDVDADGVGDGVVAFEAIWQHERVGRVELLHGDTGEAELIWLFVPEYRAVGVVERALRLVVRWAFDELGLRRIEARVEDEDRDGVRAAMRAGLRKEGVSRAVTVPGGRGDVMVLSALDDDAPPHTREGFIAQLNAALPTKRAIAQGVVRDAAGRVLLCELVYKKEWDLPGGVVDPYESPAQCVVREVREELGVEVEVRSLLAVNWLPPWRGWSDATAFIFDLGVADEELVERATLQPREIRALHWVGEEELESHVAPYNQRLLAFLLGHQGPTAYLEDGLPAL
jgi:8-oxo-dGTP pyrophosphatase MutT (NUDIX family)